MLPRTRLSAFAIAPAAIVLVAGLTGCSALAQATAHHSQVFYPTLSAASATAVATVPSFIPKDATEVTLRSLPGHGQTMMFESSSPLDPGTCHEAALTGHPRINSNWWPTTTPPATGVVCPSGWQLFTYHGATYGWTATEFSR